MTARHGWRAKVGDARSYPVRPESVDLPHTRSSNNRLTGKYIVRNQPVSLADLRGPDNRPARSQPIRIKDVLLLD